MASGSGRPPPGPTLFHLLMHIGRLLEDRCRDELAAYGLHHGQARVLMTLSRRGPQGQADLARGMDLAPPTLSVMLKKLLDQKLVRRTRVPGDERGYEISLTAEGEQAAGVIKEVWDRADRAIRRAAKEGEDPVLHDLLRSVRDALGGRSPKL